MNIPKTYYIENYPLVALATVLIVGIILGENYNISYHTLFSGMFMIVALALVFVSLRKQKRLTTIGYLTFTILFGITITKNATKEIDFEETNDYETFEAVVMTEPTVKTNGASVDVKVIDGRMEGKTIRLFIVEGRKDLLGSQLSVKAKIRHPKVMPNSRFDYSLYLWSHGISGTATVYPSNYQQTRIASNNLLPLDRLKVFLLSIRKKMIDRLRSIGMEEQAFAVTSAMALGDKSEVARSTSNIYSLAGTSHVLALSGLHLSIVFGLFAVFGGLWRRSLAMVIGSVGTMWVYVVLAGSPVSMIRSAIMLSVSTLVGLSGRNGITLNTLSFSAIIILIANPFALHDVGFQLSFAAVAFLGTFASRLSRILPSYFLMRHPCFSWCWQMTVTSIVAQLGTTPLIAYHFGRLPLYFLPANFIAIPAATIILYLVVAFFIFSWLPWAAAAIGSLLSITSSVLNSSMAFISQLKYSSLTIENMSIPSVICLYIIIISLLLILQHIRIKLTP